MVAVDKEHTEQQPQQSKGLSYDMPKYRRSSSFYAASRSFFSYPSACSSTTAGTGMHCFQKASMMTTYLARFAIQGAIFCFRFLFIPK